MTMREQRLVAHRILDRYSLDIGSLLTGYRVLTHWISTHFSQYITNPFSAQTNIRRRECFDFANFGFP